MCTAIITTRAKSRKGLNLRGDHTIVIWASPQIVRRLLLAGMSKILLAPLEQHLMFNCNFSTVNKDAMDKATALVLRYHSTAQPWSYHISSAFKAKLLYTVIFTNQRRPEHSTGFILNT